MDACARVRFAAITRRRSGSTRAPSHRFPCLNVHSPVRREIDPARTDDLVMVVPSSAAPSPSVVPSSPAVVPTGTPPPSVPAAIPPSSSDSVLQKTMPQVSQSARDTIQGTIRVVIRVRVDASGNVADATFDNHGPSGYFADRAMQRRVSGSSRLPRPASGSCDSSSRRRRPTLLPNPPRTNVSEGCAAKPYCRVHSRVMAGSFNLWPLEERRVD